ncbi:MULTISPECIES: ribbon-helix-helix protein, CopG family [Natrialbaceae]|uniref:Ribbon-helix-helix protein CopG domain-containing protein n=2 Tax=Natronorubrum bangense TaxID=61858 RepID=L9WBR9_9EURY|nr:MULTISPECIES: ribbon-helix-helix protein, CopG family [Natrialbaceae]ELY46935.1 hypothetical protein C494_13601 [Natronorubrum bangense JCM 10635]MDQ2051670.1 ribbon-helix-helix protein, CopG family [Natronolimnohabitans sp. A-GB9]QCC56531.1 ribbon-helix-helix protein, CopG family [Natronorubrum bangense]
MGTTRVNFRIPDELVEKADVAAKITHKNRTEIVTEALQSYLDEIEDEDAFNEEIVELYLEDEISFDVLKTFIGRQDAEAVRTSKAVLDQSENLADELAGL